MGAATQEGSGGFLRQICNVKAATGWLQLAAAVLKAVARRHSLGQHEQTSEPDVKDLEHTDHASPEREGAGLGATNAADLPGPFQSQTIAFPVRKICALLRKE